MCSISFLSSFCKAIELLTISFVLYIFPFFCHSFCAVPRLFIVDFPQDHIVTLSSNPRFLRHSLSASFVWCLTFVSRLLFIGPHLGHCCRVWGFRTRYSSCLYVEARKSEPPRLGSHFEGLTLTSRPPCGLLGSLSV